ncbi:MULTISPECIES: PEPxxWA-CTERM sorting domain-containing protein [Sphingomonas]|uniref:PEPxxWA-CTERM sorting domain-containing protein n=1 Tax=Sphingomonas TaxID=13687 RepID=UPI000DEF62E2|nr:MULTISPECIES: PEPxxWA-CTERM sorting domain-containing protein [Sphingomonas]
MNQGTKRNLTVGALLSAGLVAVAGTPLALQTLADHGYDVPTLSTPQSLLALLDARSPGERAKGALTATKTKKLAANAVRPHERALGKIVNPAAPNTDFAEALAPPAAAEVAPPLAPPPTLAEVLPKVTGVPGNSAPGGSVLVGAPGGGGGGGTPGTPGTPSAPPTDVPAVPEPATWLTMLLGFGVIGSAQRRRRPARSGPALSRTPRLA